MNMKKGKYRAVTTNMHVGSGGTKLKASRSWYFVVKHQDQRADAAQDTGTTTYV